jgi:hypothetical protein
MGIIAAKCADSYNQPSTERGGRKKKKEPYPTIQRRIAIVPSLGEHDNPFSILGKYLILYFSNSILI